MRREKRAVYAAPPPTEEDPPEMIEAPRDTLERDAAPRYDRFVEPLLDWSDDESDVQAFLREHRDRDFNPELL